MNIDPLREIFLTRQQQRLNEVVREYLIANRRDEYRVIENQAPNIIGRKYNMFLTSFITLCIVILNYDNLFVPQQVPTQLVEFENFEETQKQIQYVFEHTIMKYSVVYPMKVRKCQSFIPFLKPDTFCSQKSIEAKVKFTYDIGFRPNYQMMSYYSHNNTILGEWGPLEILSVADQRIIESQINGFLNAWSVLEFEQKFNQMKKIIKPQIQQKINQYIDNISSNSNSLQKFERNIKNSLMKIVNGGKTSRQSLIDQFLNNVNGIFDKLLIFFSMNPLHPKQQMHFKDNFTQYDANQFWKQQILVQEEVNKIQTQIARVINENQNSINKQHLKSKDKSDASQIQQSAQTNKGDNYNSEEIRLLYNQLLKKVK